MAKRVFIGVGHGGSDPGAVKYVKEADTNLTIALELKRLLEQAGIVVGISRTKDENDPLTEEINEANAFKPDFAIDVHNNAGGGDGFEVFVQTGTHAAKSKAAGQAIEAAVKAMGQNSRGVKTQINSYGTDWFGFTREVNAPAVIVEGFFVDHAEDAADFDTEAEQKKLAAAYAKGIMEYLGVEEPKEEVDALYRVQVGAFKEKKNADRQYAKVKKAGFDAILVKVGGLYKVQVGAFKVYGNAEAMLAKIKKAGFAAYITVKGGTVVSADPVKKSVEEVAREVIRGDWGNGTERKERLTAAGYDYAEVQKAVNALL